MWRGSTTACSMKTVGSPKAPSASRMQVSMASRSVARVVDPSHAAAAASGDGLDEQRGTAGPAAAASSSSTSVGRRDARQGRHAGRLGRRDRAGLVAGQGQHLGRRPDEGDAGVGAGLGQGRVLREEAVAGVDRVGAGPQRHRDDRVGVEVGPHRVAVLADLVGLVGLEPVLGPAVLVGEDGDRARADLIGRAERPDRDLAPVGHQHLGEHGARLVCPHSLPPRRFSGETEVASAWG